MAECFHVPGECAEGGQAGGWEDTWSRPGPRAGLSTGLRLPLPTGGWHRARRGHRRVRLSSGLGAGAAAVCGVVQSLRCNQVRHSPPPPPHPPGIHGKTVRSKIASAHNTFRIQKILPGIIGTLSPCMYHKHQVLGLCMCEFLHCSACGRCLVQSLSSRPAAPRDPDNDRLSVRHQPQDRGHTLTQPHDSFVLSGQCLCKAASHILYSNILLSEQTRK